MSWCAGGSLQKDHLKKHESFSPRHGHQEILKKVMDGCSSVGENAAVAFHCKVRLSVQNDGRT